MERTELLKALGLEVYVAFDFETTGLSPDKDRIIEIAALRIEGGEVVDRLVTLVNPGCPIGPLITEITGISDSMVAGAPPENEIGADLVDFLADHPLVAHNVAFDKGFLKALQQRHGLAPGTHRYYDTLSLSRTLINFHPVHNLGAMAEFFGLSSKGAHRAEKDAENCAKIFLDLILETASYPLEVISTIAALLKPFEVANKDLYRQLAREMIRRGEKGGLVESTITKPAYRNIIQVGGQTALESLTVEDVFSEQGPLQAVLDNYEVRPAQVQYSQKVEDLVLADDGLAVFEAGTGLGKSLAYLFPALKRARVRSTEGPIVISCYTKHLQDQLFNKDLPLLAQALDASLKAVVLKGRSNYICRTRLDWLLGEAQRLLRPRDVEALLPLIFWLQWTRTGDLSECAGFWNSGPFRVADLVHSERGFCTGGLCARHRGCFLGPLRKAVYQSDIIVVNHALLLAELKSAGLLPPYQALIVDEAHDLIKSAYGQLALQMDRFRIHTLAEQLNPNSTLARRWNQTLKQLGELEEAFGRHRQTLQKAARELVRAGDEFFHQLGDLVGSRFGRHAKYTQKVVIDNLTEELGPVDPELKALESCLQTLLQTVQALSAELARIDTDHQDYPELQQVFAQRSEELGDLLRELNTLTGEQRGDWVYWLEGAYKNSGQADEYLDLNLQACPVDISTSLVQGLFEPLKTCLLTSATLRVEESFDYFLGRAGLDPVRFENLVTDIFPSPFHYPDQVRYFQYTGSPNNFTATLSDVIYRCHKHYNKRIMALFTSRQMLKETYTLLRSREGGQELPLLAQLYGASRHALIRGLHHTANGILLGTNAFWEGVDLPGELLEILIITKLPFDVPSEPVVKSYGELLMREGKDAFLDYTVPESVIRFRQGFGRLIRTVYDEGLFIVMDDRVVKKRYGFFFSSAVPTAMVPFQEVDEILI